MVAYFAALMVMKMAQLKASETTVYKAGWTVPTLVSYLAAVTVVKMAPHKALKMGVYWYQRWLPI